MCGSRPVYGLSSGRSWRVVSSRTRWKALENDIIAQLIPSRLPRFLKALAKAAAGIKWK